MKQSTVVGLFLTILMVTLVLVAIVVFSLQGRSRLLDNVATLDVQNRQLQNAVDEQTTRLATVEAERLQANAAMATAQTQAEVGRSEVGRLNGQLTELEATRESQGLALAGTQATAEALQLAQEQARLAPPEVVLVTPVEGDVFQPGDPIVFIFSASDAFGLTSINLNANDETIFSDTLDDQPLVTFEEVWLPDLEGEVAISLLATDVDGQANEPLVVTIRIVDIDAENTAIRGRVEANVVTLRSLTPITPVIPTTLNRDALRTRVEEDLFEDFSEAEAADNALVLYAFDLLERGFDLYTFTLALYGDLVLGFYDPETDEFVVVTDDGVLDLGAQLTHAHEFMHALQDQHFQLDSLRDEENLDSEARFAIRALAEGEAELVEALYTIQFLSDQEVARLRNTSSGADTSILDTAPRYLIQELTFPYQAGSEFVVELYLAGGFGALDEAWANPPQSTEHILHPDRYLAGDDPPLRVSLPPLTSTLGVGWRRLDEDVLGEFVLRQYLVNQLGEARVDEAATGWGGDRYAVYYNDTSDELVMVLKLMFDTAEDVAEFDSAYADYARGWSGSSGTSDPGGPRCWAAGEIVCLYDFRSGAGVNGPLVIIRGPDRATISAVAAAVQRQR